MITIQIFTQRILKNESEIKDYIKLQLKLHTKEYVKKLINDNIIINGSHNNDEQVFTITTIYNDILNNGFFASNIIKNHMNKPNQLDLFENN